VGNLLLFSPELREFAPVVGGIWNVGVKEQKEVESLDDIVEELGKHQSIDQFVIFTHGYPGGMMLEDGNAYTLTDEKVTKAFAKLKNTRAEHIRFEGCWVGEAPEAMAAFGALLHAATVSGYTWEHMYSNITVTIPKKVTAAALETAIKPYWKWRAPFPPVSVTQLASMAQTHEAKRPLMMEWYKYAEISSRAKPPWEVAGQDVGLGPRGYKTRSQATQRSVKAKDAKRSTDPVPPFEYVTVELRSGS
jgi:hypothetical protein